MKYLLLLSLAASLASASPRSASAPVKPAALADEWRHVGAVLTEPGYDAWCCSPLREPDGRIHLYVARWPAAIPFDKGWRTHSEIAHYVGARPEGPFRFVSVIGKGAGTGWNARAYHNPSVRKIDGVYTLTFIANSGAEPHSPSQNIGMMLADSPDGPWREVPGPVLATPSDPALWCAGSGSGVTNPALLKIGGKFHLYFKARSGPKGVMSYGVAVADALAGPYRILPKPVVANATTIEDAFAFPWRGDICLLSTDNHGILEEGGGLLWTSRDGLAFDPKPLPGFHHFGHFHLRDRLPANANYRYTRQVKVERPQLLLDAAGEPEWLYAPCGVAIDGADGTSVHLFRRTATAAGK